MSCVFKEALDADATKTGLKTLSILYICLVITYVFKAGTQIESKKRSQVLYCESVLSVGARVNRLRRESLETKFNIDTALIVKPGKQLTSVVDTVKRINFSALFYICIFESLSTRIN